MSRRIRHATDASSITGGSSINGNLQEGHDETDGVVAASILSNVLIHPTNNINWFRSEIQRLKFGKSIAFSTMLTCYLSADFLIYELLFLIFQ